MKRRFNLKKGVVGCLLALSACLLSLQLPVNAAPGYDDDYQSIQSVSTGASNFYNINCNAVDISSTWKKYITDPNTWYNPNEANNPSSWNYQAKASFETALTSGRWGVSQHVQYHNGGYFKVAVVFWTEDTSLSLNWNDEAITATSSSSLHSLSIGCSQVVYERGGSEPVAWDYGSGGTRRISNDIPFNANPTSSVEAEGVANYFVYTDNPNYPTDGLSVRTFNVDYDNDGLIEAREVAQGTSDMDLDTDGDGLSDYIESEWNPDRDDVFCGTQCAYPNPTAKDLYVEIDWMGDSTNSGTYKPTSTQLATAASTYAAHGITAHFDTGQYGGGNELPNFTGSLIFAPTENELDFYDLKNGTLSITANFNPLRKNIWRYMITGANFMKTENDAGSTGASFSGDDDSLISIEKVTELNSGSLDTAIAGTLLHELGHNLCLSDIPDYLDQPEECVYGEIDKPLDQNPSTDYESVMNYRYQLTRTDYSSGANGVPDDHDDWSAIALGIDDFQNSVFEWTNTETQRRGFSGQENSLSREDIVSHIQD